MELIKRYVYAVGKKVARNQREDIKKELESSIYDNLEDLYGKKESYSEEEITKILKSLGHPIEVAAGYNKSSKFLIGPKLINTYYLVVKIVSGATFLGLLISFIVGLFAADLTIKKFILDFLKLIPSAITGIISAIGFVTVIFYLIERNVPEYKLEEAIEFEKWQPKDLPKVPNENEKISLAESIIGLTFSIVFLVIFNLFANKIGIYYTPALGEEFRFIDIFSQDAIVHFLPFWNISWIISIIFEIYCIIQREWNIKIRLFDLFTSLVSIAVLILMLNGPELIKMRELLSNASTGVRESLTPIAEFLNYSLDKVFIFGIVCTIIAIIVKTVKIFIALPKTLD